MNRMRANVMIAGLAVAMMTTGCHKNVSAQNQSNDLGPDPAAANMAPGDAADTSQQPAPAGQGTNEAITAAQTAQPPADQGAPPADNQAVDQGYAAVDDSNDVDYDDAAAQADQAPPPLPEYDQPPLPDDGYIWTPGYWAWAPAGYYWVPGAWTMPPYQGALWTPGWWGFHSGRYFFFRGYWGHYIGYYGGINYGFGYVGRGYEGGYWQGNRFQYNRTVNVIRITNVNVYVHPVQAPQSRYSFNGPGGARLRPAPAELVAMRGPRVAPMSTQIQAQHAAQQNRAQFASENHGRPAAVVVARPIAADPHTQPLAPARVPAQQNRPGFQPGQPVQNHPAPQQPQNFARPQQPVPQNRPQPAAPQNQPQRPENFSRPAAPQAQPAPQNRPAPQAQPAPQQRPQSFGRPAPQQSAPQAPASEMHSSGPQQAPQQFHMQQPAQQPRPAPQPEQPRPAPQAAPAPRPAPAARPAPAPAPAPRPAAAPAPRPAPQGNERDDRPH